MLDSNAALGESKTHSEPPCYDNNNTNNNNSGYNLLMAYSAPRDVLYRNVLLESSKEPYEPGSIFAFFTDVETEVQRRKSLD